MLGTKAFLKYKKISNKTIFFNSLISSNNQYLPLWIYLSTTPCSVLHGVVDKKSHTDLCNLNFFYNTLIHQLTTWCRAATQLPIILCSTLTHLLTTLCTILIYQHHVPYRHISRESYVLQVHRRWSIATLTVTHIDYSRLTMTLSTSSTTTWVGIAHLPTPSNNSSDSFLCRFPQLDLLLNKQIFKLTVIILK